MRTSMSRSELNTSTPAGTLFAADCRRPAKDRQRDRTQGAKAVGQVARHRNWHGPAHLKGASNEPARGAAMTIGPQLTNNSLRRA
jgi:hypothetical protein